MRTPATIFIVDDDDAARTTLQTKLQFVGYKVAAHASCRSFIENFHSPGKACLILDLHLQDMGAWEPGTFLKKCGAQIPIVLVTRRDDPALKTQISGCGTMSLLGKPFDHDLLLKTIDRVLQ
ncbi:MAG: two-component system response regulator FixJ [Alphaproteobacteria bacterium]|jgi:two-component system response regulator FixJ